MDFANGVLGQIVLAPHGGVVWTIVGLAIESVHFALLESELLGELHPLGPQSAFPLNVSNYANSVQVIGAKLSIVNHRFELHIASVDPKFIPDL